MTKNDQTSAWQALHEHCGPLFQRSLRDLFAHDGERFKRHSIELDGLLFDYSKHRLTHETIDLLIALAREAGFENERDRLFSGGVVNPSEGRAALHVALRGEGASTLEVAGTDVHDSVRRVLDRMTDLSDAIRSGRYLGFSGKPISDVVHIGIGGSDLGPRLALKALAKQSDGPRVHFVSNIDGTELDACLGKLDPSRTLFTIASKSFGTQETLLNGRVARSWVNRAAGGADKCRSHFVAVTAKPELAREFGVAEENILPLWDWVGGRYSLWSAVGLPVAIGCGMDVFRQLLSGAAEMDRHFVDAPPERNMPLIMALVGIWCRNFLGMSSLAVVPYTERLSLLPAYLQQLEMESNGKAVTRDGTNVSWSTVPVIWGQTGTTGQHAFFQALHQGTDAIPVDFIGVAESDVPDTGHQDHLLANMFAQSEALMCGLNEEEARAQMQQQGLSEEQIRTLLPYRVFPGNRPSSTLLLEALSARNLGKLVALYEHKVFSQAVVWRLNAFDQWGVELGKRLANDLLPCLTEGSSAEAHDASTQGLVTQYRRWSNSRR